MFIRKKAASTTEIGLVLGLIAVIILTAVSGIGSRINSLFATSGTLLNEVVKSTNTPTYEEGLEGVCKVQLSNLRQAAEWSAALSKFELKLSNGGLYNFGAITTDTRTLGVFENGTISASSTYANGISYHIGYILQDDAHSHYWLGGQGSTPHTVTITLNNPSEVTALHITDKAENNPNGRATAGGYIVTVSDCENNTLFSTTVTEQLSPEYKQYGVLPLK